MISPRKPSPDPKTKFGFFQLGGKKNSVQSDEQQNLSKQNNGGGYSGTFASHIDQTNHELKHKATNQSSLDRNEIDTIS